MFNFTLFLFVLTIVTCVLWIGDKVYWAPQRNKLAQETYEQFKNNNAEAFNRGVPAVLGEAKSIKEKILKQPVWLEYTAGLFPVILAVFILRSFVTEPFRIPSGSMLPTIEPGDFVLVNKFEYGLRFPVFNFEITQGSPLKRGDIVVFKYPLDKNVDFIKRVIGLPGDEIQYMNKELYVNGQKIEATKTGIYYDEESFTHLTQLVVQTGDTKHRILHNDNVASQAHPITPFEHIENCAYSMGNLYCKVPEKHYFMMGDNRDNSADSRFWGFVSKEDIVGKAYFIWLNIKKLSRIGFIK